MIDNGPDIKGCGHNYFIVSNGGIAGFFAYPASPFREAGAGQARTMFARTQCAGSRLSCRSSLLRLAIRSPRGPPLATARIYGTHPSAKVKVPYRTVMSG